MQSDGDASDVLNINLTEMWKGFGWEVITVADGHDIPQLYDALNLPPTGNRPRVIIARTVKGKGVAMMENNNEWHHKQISKDTLDVVLQEISEKKVSL